MVRPQKLSSQGRKDLTLAIILDMYGYQEDKFPIKNLGIPIKPRRLSRQNWNPLFETFERRLDGWKGNLLSLGGRVILLNSVFSTLLLYYMLFLCSYSGLETELIE